MEKRRVHRVDDRIQHLQPVAGETADIGHHRHARDLVGVVDREWRNLRERTHVGEDQALVFAHRIGALAQARARLLGALAVRRLARRLEDAAVHVEQPAVVAAADAALLADAVFERGLAVAAIEVKEPVAPGLVAEEDEILAHHPDPLRQIGNLGGDRDGMPEATQILAAGRARADPRRYSSSGCVAGTMW